MADTKLSDYDKQQFGAFVRQGYETWWKYQSYVHMEPIIDDLLTMAYTKKEYRALHRINDVAPEVFEKTPDFNLHMPGQEGETFKKTIRFIGRHGSNAPSLLTAMPGKVMFDPDHSKRLTKIVDDLLFCDKRRDAGIWFASLLMDLCKTAGHLNYLVPDLIGSITEGHLYNSWSGRLTIKTKVERLTGRERYPKSLPYFGNEISNQERFEYERDQAVRDMIRSSFCARALKAKPFDKDTNYYNLAIW